MKHSDRVNKLLSSIERADRQLDTVEKVDYILNCCKELFEFQTSRKRYGGSPENPISLDSISADASRASDEIYTIWRIASCLKKAKSNGVVVPLPTWVEKYIDMRVSYYIKLKLPKIVPQDDTPSVRRIRSAGESLSRLLDLDMYFDIQVPHINQIKKLRETIQQYWVFGGHMGISESDES